MASKLIGANVLRTEDKRFLTGNGRYTDDFQAPGQLHVAFLRSPHAHADISHLDIEPAKTLPDVVAVFTGRDYLADNNQPLVHLNNLPDHLDPTVPTFAPDELAPTPSPPPMAVDRVRYVGEIVAMAIASTAEIALDAIEAISIDFEPLPAVTDAMEALPEGAPKIWNDDNLCVSAERGDADKVSSAMDTAPHVVRTSFYNQRIHGSPLEPRAVIAEFDEMSGRYTLRTPSQGVHRYKRALAAVLGVDVDRMRVVTTDVGGGFGVRIPCTNEYPLLLWAAARCGASVRWLCSRNESFLADLHSRDLYCDAALALDESGQILAVDLDYVGNVGAHPFSFAVLSNLLRMAGPPYDVPAMNVRVRGVYTNTVPTSVFRGAGRPEVTYVIERLMDLAAHRLGQDRASLRRRNLIACQALPYRTRLGLTYDSGDFISNFDNIHRAVDWDGFPARRDEAARRGKLAGIGIANYLESPGAAPYERTDITVRPDGHVQATIGTQASGQGHETSFAQVLAETLQIPFASVSIVFGDTDKVVDGSGSHADRSMRLGGTILVQASERIIELGLERAVGLLEAAAADIRYADGRFRVAGTDRSVSLFDTAAAAQLMATGEISTRLHAHPNGVAACEVEIDPETGALSVRRYITVDDVGRVINPMIVEGQIHGGIAQGIGHALFEQVAYDPETGQLLTGTLMDYCLPRAGDVPKLEGWLDVHPTKSNPLGVKGAGEAGITPTTAALVSAAVDALRDYGVTQLDMPLTSERIWRAMGSGEESNHL